MFCTARFMSYLLALLLAGGAGVSVSRAADGGDPLHTRTVERAYSDVRIDVQNAIINQGLTIDFNGRLGDMLKRTAKDVGATGDLYVDAEYFTFCSSRLSRMMMDADPGNVGLCPYTVFMYERVGEEGKVTVGYKAMPSRGDAGSQAALAEINTLLKKILDEATE
ncbi:MAG: DUF302 domain-containing protein [Hyphomicrobiaceae bacterium]|nr:DUF302 domain-containing protein [Hyphomicrobiaceae bacterium]MCC0007062.1 DUF302 domain-containing protein [Hyphomicrobiaceae bacterium]